jgi:hypothetical protein
MRKVCPRFCLTPQLQVHARHVISALNTTVKIWCSKTCCKHDDEAPVKQRGKYGFTKRSSEAEGPQLSQTDARFNESRVETRPKSRLLKAVIASDDISIRIVNSVDGLSKVQQ